MNQLNCGWRVLCGRRHGGSDPENPASAPTTVAAAQLSGRHSSIGGSNNRSLTAAEPTHSLARKAPPVLRGRGGGNSDRGTARGLAARNPPPAPPRVELKTEEDWGKCAVHGRWKKIIDGYGNVGLRVSQKPPVSCFIRPIDSTNLKAKSKVQKSTDK